MFATNKSVNEGISSSFSALPINCLTKVRVEAVGRDVHLYLNNTLDSAVQLSSERVFGDAILYVSDPWHPAAVGSISSINMVPITSMTQAIVSHSSTSTLRRFLTYTRTNIPENYSISFDITPTGIVSSWANILRYTKDNTNAGPGGRIPGTYSSL